MRQTLLLLFLLLLSACAVQAQNDSAFLSLEGTYAYFTPAPRRDLSGLDETQLGYMNIQPQPWIVADNRVYAFVHAHDYIDGCLLALEDGTISTRELENISQLSANAEAGLYRQGDHDLFWIADEIDRLTYLAVTGEWETFEEGVGQLRRRIPARPDPGN